jgi:phage-related protein
MGFWDSVSGFFKSTASKVGDFVNRSAQWVQKVAIPEVYKAATPVVNAIHQDLRDFAGGVKEVIKGGQDIVKNTVNKAGDTITGAVSSLAWPLGIGVAVVGGLFLLKK